MRRDVYEFIKEFALRGETVTYKEIMDKFGIPRGGKGTANTISTVLGDISEFENVNGRPLLTAIVVRADSKTRKYPQGLPGGGFFGLSSIPSHLKKREGEFETPLNADQKTFACEEQIKVWDYWMP